MPFSFQTFDDPADLVTPIFNNLLGINNEDLIAGFYGSGAKHDPNQGFLRGRWVDVRPNWKERPTAPTKLRYD